MRVVDGTLAWQGHSPNSSGDLYIVVIECAFIEVKSYTVAIGCAIIEVILHIALSCG